MNQEIYEAVMSNTTTPELVEKYFPKGECQERGKAIVLHAEMLIVLAKSIAEAVPEKIFCECIGNCEHEEEIRIHNAFHDTFLKNLKEK